MKRFLALALAITAIALVPVAADESPLSVSAGGALGWSQRYDTGILIADVFLGLRGGVWGDAMFDVAETISLGGELGMYYMRWKDKYDATVFLGDFPVQAKASFALGVLRLDTLGGVLLTMDIGGNFFFGANALAGARLTLGSLYAEADYLFRLGATPEYERSVYPRFMIGYTTKLID